MNLRQTLHAALTERRLLKVIAGITNFDHLNVLAIARAAKAGGAQAVDVAADPALVAEVKAETGLMVFVSSTEPAKLAACAGVADVLELGNFDAMYRDGVHPTAAQILGWAREIKASAGETPVCVTVSGYLTIDEQRALAVDLQDLGIDILQTEGQVGPESDDTFKALAGAISALGNTAEIRKVTTLPLLLAGGFNALSAPFAIAAGADALGVGKAVSRHADEAAMTNEVRSLVEALDAARAAGKGLAAV